MACPICKALINSEKVIDRHLRGSTALCFKITVVIVILILLFLLLGEKHGIAAQKQHRPPDDAECVRIIRDGLRGNIESFDFSEDLAEGFLY